MKKYFVGTLAILLAIGFSSFTAFKTKPLADSWFRFNGSVGQEGNAALYSSEGSPTCSSLMGDRCDIYATFSTVSGHTTEPNLSTITDEKKKP